MNAITNYIHNKHEWIDATLWKIFEVPEEDRETILLSDDATLMEKYGFKPLDFAVVAVNLGIQYDEQFLKECQEEEENAKANSAITN